MTSTPSTILLLRSGNAADRPSGVSVQGGETALCFGAADPGLYFEDTTGAIRKIGPVHYGTTPPNTNPVGLSGNINGELWTDNTPGPQTYYMKVWNGSSWSKVSAGFADSVGATPSALTAVLASGAIAASGAFSAVIASGALSSLISSGTVLATGVPVAAIVSGLPAVSVSGAVVYRTTAPSGLYVGFAAGWAKA